MTLPTSNVVNVSISLAALAAGPRSFGSLLILGTTTGVIDKIEYNINGIPKIVDYKSGALDTKKLKEITTNSIGGDYRRQLWMYKLMYENYRPNKPKIQQGEIAYLQKNKDGIFPLESIIFEKEEEKLFHWT